MTVLAVLAIPTRILHPGNLKSQVLQDRITRDLATFRYPFWPVLSESESLAA